MIVMAQEDNVGIAARDIAQGESALDIRGHELVARETISQGHKIALCDIASGDLIIRFAMPVAVTTAAIGRGDLVHVHNVASRYLTNDEDHFE